MESVITTKTEILELMQRLPDEVSIDEAIERLYLLRKIRIGLQQADAGEVVPHEEVKRRFGRN